MPPPVNHLCSTATTVGALPFNDPVDVELAVTPVDPSCEAGVEHTVWWVYSPVSDSPVTISTIDSQGWGTVLAIYTGTCGALVQVVCNENYPAIYNFLATGGVTYYIAVSLYGGSTGSDIVDFTVEAASLPSTPVLAASSTTARTVTLTWGALTDTDTVEIERSTDNVNWTVVATVGISSPYVDRGLTASTVYYHRIRGDEATFGYGDYSNTTTTTTAVDGTGIVQYAIYMGGVASYGRAVEQMTSMALNVLPPIFQVTGVFQLWIEVNQEVTQPGGPGTTLFSTAKLLLRYWHGNSSTWTAVLSSGYVLPTQETRPGEPWPNYTDLDQRIEIFAYMGSADTVTGTHAEDGFIRVKLDNVTIFDIADIALGTTGTTGYTNIVVGPSGSWTFAGVTEPQNGGMSEFFFGDETDGIANVFDYDFSTLVDADLFTTIWFRRNGISGLDQGAPSVIDDKLSDSLIGSTQRGWMSLQAGSLLTPPTVYVPGDPPDPPGTLTGLFSMTPSTSSVIPGSSHDTYNGDVTKKIPNPTVRTALLGE